MSHRNCVQCNAGMPAWRVNPLCEECYAESREDYDSEAEEDDSADDEPDDFPDEAGRISIACQDACHGSCRWPACMCYCHVDPDAFSEATDG